MFYPRGRGKLVRFRQGLSVGLPGGAAKDAAITGALLLVGHIRIRGARSANVSMTLPSDVNETIPAGVTMSVEVLAKPEFDTRGFPVLPAKRAG